ncbi:MAG: ribonuclease Y [Chloroflexi bacterium]|nr:ribonuclease Y [Chloroflexota bacterium]
MTFDIQGLVAFLAMLILGFAIGFVVRQYLGAGRLRAAEAQSHKILEEARTQKKEALLEAEKEALKLRKEAEEEMRRLRSDLRRQEERLQRRQEQLDRRVEPLEARERKAEHKERELAKKEEDLENLRRQKIQELQRLANLSQEEAKQLLLQSIEAEAREDAARVLRKDEEETKEQANSMSREILSTVMQRCASEYVAENTVSTVPLPSDERKGRIIGKQGRNIRALENALGVDLIIDDTPEAVTISSFDPVRRELARMVLTRLIMDGRIQPARIERVVEKTQQELDSVLMEEGERALYELGLPPMHPELVKLIGRLKYRTSYGQNQLEHAIEVAHIASMLAAELGVNLQLAKEAALLHDIGKAVSHEVEGTHAQIGADLARKYGRPPQVINAIAAHHHEEEQKYVEAVIAEIADAISGARPGARRESLESYLKRLKALEEVATSFPGVSEAYAIEAGREIRIIVRPGEIDDLAAIRLSKEIAKKVQETQEYPGQVKVTVIREVRAMEYAK